MPFQDSLEGSLSQPGTSVRTETMTRESNKHADEVTDVVSSRGSEYGGSRKISQQDIHFQIKL